MNGSALDIAVDGLKHSLLLTLMSFTARTHGTMTLDLVYEPLML